MKKCSKRKVALIAELLADKLTQVYRDEQIAAMVDGFTLAGFSKTALEQDPAKLFQMSVIVAHDRRPFTPAAGGFEVTWGIRPGSQEMRLVNCGDLRDRKAITRLATGFLKLLFPNMKPAEEEFKELCVKPAVELRQRVRDELHKMDPEYMKVSIGYE